MLKENVTFKGAPLTLSGALPQVGDRAPDFEVLDQEMKAVTLSSYKGKWVLLISVPSLDTPVCSSEARHFNEHLAQFAGSLEALIISMDLPFAQKRFCESAGMRNVHTLSDFKKREFGKKYGLCIEELGLLARSLFLVDGQGVIRYKQLVKEVTQEPNYVEWLKACQPLLATIK